jgi:undecaprenyl-phosphate galactose phosphotransferase/putative colanic acid biosynthesis UDP-glucose lipid carrier transferase
MLLKKVNFCHPGLIVSDPSRSSPHFEAESPRTLISGLNSQEKARGILPFYLVEVISLFSDLILIVGTSAFAGIGYHLLFLEQYGSVPTFLAVGALTGVIFAAVLAASGAYRPPNLVDLRKQVWLTTIVWLFVFFLLSAVAFSFRITAEYSRGAILIFFVVGWGAIILWRVLLAYQISVAMLRGRFSERKVLLFADPEQLDGSSVLEDLKRCGYLPAQTFKLVRGSGTRVGISSCPFAPIDEIIRTTRNQRIDCALILMSWDDRHSIDRLINELGALSMPVYLLPDKNVTYFSSSRPVNIGTTSGAELKREPLSRIERSIKRMMDLVIGALALIFLLPTMLLVAAIIKIETRGPIFFVQTRNGFNGRAFRIYKFRTMHVLEDGPIIRQATKNDPRVTNVGRLLRRTNIDELPQLFNVIRGDMSLVGPRPHAAAHNAEFETTIANYANRYHVKPGLTGWAQIYGLRGETQTLDLMKKRVEFDLWYINNWSFWLDFKIMARTLLVGIQSAAY